MSSRSLDTVIESKYSNIDEIILNDPSEVHLKDQNVEIFNNNTTNRNDITDTPDRKLTENKITDDNHTGTDINMSNTNNANPPTVSTNHNKSKKRKMKQTSTFQPRSPVTQPIRESTKRRVIPTTRFDVDTYCDNEEQTQLQAALKISKLETQRLCFENEIPLGPTYYPSEAEFENTMAYIASIEEEASKYGVCKIVPPKSYKNPCQVSSNSTFIFPTNKQVIDTLQEGDGYLVGNNYTIETYRTMAELFKCNWICKKIFQKDYEDVTLEEFVEYKREHGLICENEKTEIKTEKDMLDVNKECVEPIITDTDNNGLNHTNDYISNTNNKKLIPYEDLCSIYSIERLTRDYWDIVETRCATATVEYGNDIDTSKYASGFLKNDFFDTNHQNTMMNETRNELSHTVIKEDDQKKNHDDEYYKNCGWNLNNIAKLDGSLLKYINTPINGINVPWLYMGMLFSTFCWHNEDYYLNSINYNHYGEYKIWYGVPGSEAKAFEKVAKLHLPVSFKENPDLLHHITTQISPSLLYKHEVSVYKIIQEPGSFVLTFPQAYHGGFSSGFNVGEAVNFASKNWLRFGSDANERYRSFGRPSIFSHTRLIFVLFHKLNEFKTTKELEILGGEVIRVLDEEINARPFLYSIGLRDITKQVTLKRNNFDNFDDQNATFDEMRTCHSCQDFCIFTAVACECNNSRVSCIRHHHLMCKCPPEKKFVLEWASLPELKDMRTKAISMCSI